MVFPPRFTTASVATNIRLKGELPLLAAQKGSLGGDTKLPEESMSPVSNASTVRSALDGVIWLNSNMGPRACTWPRIREPDTCRYEITVAA